MPTYEYRCPAGHTFDRFMKMSESVAELPCPDCGAVAARQVSGGAGLVFKGSGFYLTDYGRNAHRTSGPANAGTTPAGGEAKPAGESKPASESKTAGEKSSSKGGPEGGSRGSAGTSGATSAGSSGSGGSSGGSGSAGGGSQGGSKSES